MRLSRRALNRTLLHRQHLLARTDATPHAMAGHLVGLQAQENLPPYLSLAARLSSFDPTDVTAGLEDRSLVRLLTMRGTIHLLPAEDAVVLRPWTQQRMEAELRSSQNVRDVKTLDRDAFDAALREVLADGPLPQRDLAAALGTHFTGAPPAQLGQLARLLAPLAQLPPRGCWKQSGGVVYDYVDRWTGHDLVEPTTEVLREIVRRYLRAFGPATAADVTAWSAVTRLGPVLKEMDDLVHHEDEHGKPLYDVAEGELADEDVPAPVRLLGAYDNLWLSHAGRDRVTDPDSRNAWMAENGASAFAFFADGWLVGLWRAEDGRIKILQTLRTLTRTERAELDEEITLVEQLLAG